MDSNTWSKLISAVKSQSISIGGLLNSAHIVELNGNNLKLGVYYKFHKDKLEEAKTKKMLEDALQSVMGTNIGIEFSLAEAPIVQNNMNLSDINDNNVLKAAEDLFM